jgi:protein TonB
MSTSRPEGHHSLPSLLLGLVCALGGAACSRSTDPTGADAAVAVPTTTDATADRTATNPARDRLALAVSAFREGRLFDPSGDNALEHYAAVLALDASNAAAREALSDLFPLALARAEAAAARGDAADASRVLELLASVYPDSGAVASLRERLREPATSAVARETGVGATPGTAAPDPAPAPASMLPSILQESSAEAPSRAPIAAAPAEVAERPAPVEAYADTRTPAPAESSPPAGNRAADVDARPATDPATPANATSRAPTAAATAARLIERVPPDYPPIARQRRIEGWVELEYVVDAAGRVTDVRVLGSHPSRMFEAAAERALRRWRFEPAIRNGVPEASVGRTRIDFTLG